MLSRGLKQLERRHSIIYKRIKQALPRRESGKKTHALARHNDILQSVETRLNMLNMSYSKYINLQLCCFVPGKVLDEIRHLLNMVESDRTPPRAHEVLQELRDLSSMAIEHFEEYLFPKLKEQEMKKGSPENALKELEVVVGSLGPFSRFQGVLRQNVAASPSRGTRLLLQQQVQQVFSNDLQRVKRQGKTHKQHIKQLAHSTNTLYLKMRKQAHRLQAQSATIREQERKIQEQNSKILEQEASLNEIKKHVDEWDQKYKDLTAELIRARDEILVTTTPQTPAASPPISETYSPPLKHYRSNIKPRAAHILPKNYLQVDLERKRKSSLLPEIPLKRNRSPTPAITNLNKNHNEATAKINNITQRDIDLIDLKIPAMPSISYAPSSTSGRGNSTVSSTSRGSASNNDCDELLNVVGEDLSSNLRKRALLFDNGDIGSIIANSIENILNPLAGLNKRRRVPDDIDLK